MAAACKACSYKNEDGSPVTQEQVNDVYHKELINSLPKYIEEKTKLDLEILRLHYSERKPNWFQRLFGV
jgi:hypothetical protein